MFVPPPVQIAPPWRQRERTRTIEWSRPRPPSRGSCYNPLHVASASLFQPVGSRCHDSPPKGRITPPMEVLLARVSATCHQTIHDNPEQRRTRLCHASSRRPV